MSFFLLFKKYTVIFIFLERWYVFIVENMEENNKSHHSELTVRNIWAYLLSVIFVFCVWPHKTETVLLFFS